MSDDKSGSGRSVLDRIRDAELVQEALRRGVREALRQHKRAGNPVAVWREGRTVWLNPDEIPVTDEKR